MMSFPQTRLTLIQRLTSGGTEADWHLFLKDYWGSIVRFSLRWGAASLEDAEDVASETFGVLLEHHLLVRWASHRRAKLRTLLCSVVRNILSNRYRIEKARDRLLPDLKEHFNGLGRQRRDEVDAFYAAWVEDLVQRSVESLAREYYRERKGDYVRVLYSRLCERLTVAQVANALEIKPSAVVNYFRHVRQRLSKKLEGLVRGQVERYCLPDEVEVEFYVEWQRIGLHLAECGGLEAAVRRAYDLLNPVRAPKVRADRLTEALAQLTSVIRTSSDATSSTETT
jgi:DNA-directed RNA polymerase specialized sigma24 family protein